MSPSRLRSSAVLAALLCTLSAPAARADEAETEGARLFREGRALLLAERFDEACPKLAESQRLEPRGGTLLNLAACHERQGKVATAWAEFHDALAAARAEAQPNRARLAEERIAALGPRVPWLTINITAEAAAQGAHVLFDGNELQRFAWGKDMPVDPGAHALVVSAAGRVEETRTVTLREGERQTVDIASLAEVHPPDPVLPLPAPSTPKEPAPNPPGKSRWVFDVGLLVGYMNADLRVGYPNVDESFIAVSDGSQSSTCLDTYCSYALAHHGGTVGLLSLYAGYAANDWFHIGGRVIAGPRFQGGAVFATGPSASFRVWGPLWLGASFLLGYAGQSDAQGTVTPEYPWQVVSGGVPMTGSSDVAFGVGAEIRVDLWNGPRGTISLTTQPFFLGSDRGNAFVLPIGAAYRF